MIFSISENIETIQKAYPIDADGLYISSAFEYLNKYLSSIDFLTLENKFVKVSSNGRFGFHELIIFLAKLVAPCELYVSSFSLSLAAANMFLTQKKKGVFSKIDLIINTSRKNDNKQAIDLISNYSSVFFSKVHAKIAVIKSEKKSFSILSTGNLSSGGNIESFIVFTDKQSIDFDYEFLRSLYR